MKVCITEKPSVAQSIAKILGATSRHDGYMEGNGYQVTWAFGHLCELNAPEDYNPEWKHWKMDALPIVPGSFAIGENGGYPPTKNGDIRSLLCA